MNAIVLALVIVALILALVDEFRSSWQSLTAWAVVALAVAILVDQGGIKV